MRNGLSVDHPSALSLILILVGLTFLTGLFIAHPGYADSDSKKSGKCLAGTYLIEEGSGTRDIWTFNEDGTFIGTSSAQPLLNFSTLQGVWKQTDWRTVKGTVLDFSFEDQGSLRNIARVDFLVRINRHACEAIEGEFSLRFFESGEDPLHPETDTGEPYIDLFTGQRITIN